MILKSTDNIMHGKLGFNVIVTNNSKQFFLRYLYVKQEEQ